MERNSKTLGLSFLRFLIVGGNILLEDNSWEARPNGPITRQLCPHHGRIDDCVIEWMLEAGVALRIDNGRNLVPTEKGRQRLRDIDEAAAKAVREHAQSEGYGSALAIDCGCPHEITE